MKRLVRHGSVSPDGESRLALPKTSQKASSCTPLNPPVLTTGGTRRTAHGRDADASAKCADDPSATARCSAPRRGPKGRVVKRQLFGESLISCGHRSINWHLSTLYCFNDIAHIAWGVQEKAERSPDARHRGSRGIHCAGIKVDFATLKNPDASIRATVLE